MSVPTPRRWRPSRAGILNVYQYEDETLYFADGRLLLRGVNGSGKSTAMNMLLPFLLEANTRRIDAAGEQSGVLQSWMLADNDETQRTGYLWIEFGRPDEDVAGGVRHHTVGCGIRANRNTGRTTTWWFSTPRRAKIDFRLTSGKVPLSAEALRAELGTEAVFGTAAEYQAEVSRRFFGGADPSGYFGLLHQVRNPRVGDRVDTDLPERLRAALPPVPDDAVKDAAQPLEDLEGHRLNVRALEQTERALGSVLETYRQYARRVLHASADRTGDAVGSARSAQQLRGRLRSAADQAGGRERTSADLVRTREQQHRETQAELEGLLASSAYRDMQALVERRKNVDGALRHAETLERQRNDARGRLARTRARIDNRRERVDRAFSTIGQNLRELDGYGRAGLTTLPLPSAPVLRVTGAEPEGPEPGSDPLAGLALDPVGDVVRRRRREIGDVRTELRIAEKADEAAVEAERKADEAQRHADDEQERASAARAEAEVAGQRHRTAVLAWADELAVWAAEVPAAEPGGPAGWLPAPARPDPGGDELRATARERIGRASAAISDAEAQLEPARTGAVLRVRTAEAEVSRLSAELAEVRDAVELPLPRASWRSAEAGDDVLFASLVDFAPDLDADRRADLEAACEASGLLTARVLADGSVLAANGDLLAVPGRPSSPNLASVLVPALPADSATDEATVRGLLENVGLGAGSAASFWVADDGRFGAGPLRGRHTKEAAEHIGAGARADARRRRIEALTESLAVAEQVRDAEQAVRSALDAHADRLRALGRRIPPTDEVDDAVATANTASASAHRAAEQATVLRSAKVAADDAKGRAWAAAETAAASVGLRLAAEVLDDADEAMADAATVLRALTGQVGTAREALHDWSEAFGEWTALSDAVAEASEDAEQAREKADAEQIALWSTEAALGDEPERVAARATELTGQVAGLDSDLKAARNAHTGAIEAAAVARSEAASAEQRAVDAEESCLRSRIDLLAVLAVAGLLDAGRDPERADAPPSVPASVEGTAVLVAAVRERVPEPEREVGEDTLERSMRATRDSLGHGWDAESRRRTDGAPVAVEVSGPYGRRALVDACVQVGEDLRRARSLLTAAQDQALRNLLHGRIAREVARALFEARELVDGMNGILNGITTGQGIGVRLDWRIRDDLDPPTATALRLLGKDPDARSAEEDASVREAVAGLVEQARAADSEATYRDVIGTVLDYRQWHQLRIYLRRPGRDDERLTRRTRLSEGEKKLVTYLPMAAAAAASAAAHDPHAVGAPRLVLLDDAFAKVSEDNHASLFGLLVRLDLDFVVTSERLFGTHAEVPELAITEVLRDADLRTIALVHYHWDGRHRTELTGAAG